MGEGAQHIGMIRDWPVVKCRVGRETGVGGFGGRVGVGLTEYTEEGNG